MRAQLANIPDVTGQFNSVRATAGRQHLFTAGAFMLQDVKGLALAGWGVISASTGDVVSCAPLHGVWQTGPRAELCAVISAVRWAIATRVAVNLWTDCKHVVLGVQRLLDSPWDPLPIDNQDLWSQSAQHCSSLNRASCKLCTSHPTWTPRDVKVLLRNGWLGLGTMLILYRLLFCSELCCSGVWSARLLSGVRGCSWARLC